MQGTAVKQWEIRDGYIIAPGFGYDIGFDRFNDPHLLDHMAGKVWCDMGQLKDTISKATKIGHSVGDPDGDME